ncbi:MAG: J domain-containing protein [Acidimicrobiia bacterium]
MTNDPYEILGVARDASADDIKRAYRKLARENHPDANPGNPEAEARFKDISLAYEILSDPEKRQRYDAYGGADGPQFGPMDGFGIQDLFDAFFGGDPFGAARQQGPARGPDAETMVEIDLEQAVRGTTASVEVRMPVRCDRCTGSGAEPGTFPSRCETCGGAGQIRQVRRSILGQLVTASPCPQCSATGFVVATPCGECFGEGRVNASRGVDFEVPAGIADGQRLRLAGRGPAAFRGGEPGDLYVGVRVRAHPTLERHGDDLVHVQPISFAQATLGAVLVVDTFDGPEDLVVPAGTESGRLFRLRGRGVPRLRGRGRGDLLVRVDIVTPTDLTEEQEALLRQFAELRSEPLAPAEKGFFSRIKSAFQ